MGKGKNDPNCSQALAISELMEFAAAKTKAKPKPKKATPSKVSDIMGALEPEQFDEIEGIDSASAPKTEINKADLKAIARPNGSEYMPRPMETTGMTDVQVLREAHQANQPVLLGGYPGCGKTAMIEAAFGEDLYTVEGNGDMEVSDLIGSWQPTVNKAPAGWYINPDDDQQGRFYDGQEWTDQVKPRTPDTLQSPPAYIWQDGPLVKAMKEGRPLFVDDITLISAPVLARLYPAMDGRGKIHITEHEGEEVLAKEGFMVLGAHNPGAPGATLSEALSSRFDLQPRVDSNLNLAVELGVDRRVVCAARNLRVRRDNGETSWSPEMRELLAFRDLCKFLPPTAAASNMLQKAPEDCRDALLEVLTPIFPDITDLRVGD